ncbi:MAG TPA: hypothetical protein VH092_06390 [Urbifossiella sp.]|jgi:hypothetical protein|nr:hypothetical protein [Urbifossiella sp.]
MTCLVVIALLLVLWLLAVKCLAHFFGTPQAMLGFGEFLGKWFI